MIGVASLFRAVLGTGLMVWEIVGHGGRFSGGVGWGRVGVGVGAVVVVGVEDGVGPLPDTVACGWVSHSFGWTGHAVVRGNWVEYWTHSVVAMVPPFALFLIVTLSLVVVGPVVCGGSKCLYFGGKYNADCKRLVLNWANLGW